MTEAPAPPVDPKRFFARIERLALRLLNPKIESAQSLWELQLDLLTLQREIQSAITNMRRAASGSEQSSLQELRSARQHARKLGDALAWLVLGLDRRLIHSLVRNSSVPIQQEGHGSRGLIAIAAHLGSEGRGFPLIHDVTDCLRIGDVSFVRPDKDPPVSTWEVKTRVVEERTLPTGTSEFLYEVSAFSPVADHGARARAASDTLPWSESAPPGPKNSRTPPQPHRRIDRQLQRMANALKQASAESGSVIELDGQPPLVSTGFDSTSSSHWDVLRRVIRRARSTAYASEAVDDAHLYVAFYDPDGVGVDAVTNANLVEDLLASGILASESSVQNSLVVSAIPGYIHNDPRYCLPYFLYAIPKKAIIDILRGRLVLHVLTNPAQIVGALERAGFEVVEEPATVPSPWSWKILTAATNQSGAPYRAELHNLSFHVYELIYEFKSLEYIVEVARSMRDVMPIVVESAAKRTQQP